MPTTNRLRPHEHTAPPVWSTLGLSEPSKAATRLFRAARRAGATGREYVRTLARAWCGCAWRPRGSQAAPRQTDPPSLTSPRRPSVMSRLRLTRLRSRRDPSSCGARSLGQRLACFSDARFGWERSSWWPRLAEGSDGDQQRRSGQVTARRGRLTRPGYRLSARPVPSGVARGARAASERRGLASSAERPRIDG